ncbi:PRC-barrel domain-containing protein [Acuticoccus mangrovi]|uniref:PRC-barrel domain-containing protein n=1 Tax=Acuticoccus mangrovi TaxID=2796142 RepID=A0A934IQL6_9HYPH|nr:PRC-barrel domain-containing protein [Acuticoccus mangrovi]MBJ3776813.1 PRC-barrel domain-containing protein [Acuticoccus mangrovi]
MTTQWMMGSALAAVLVATPALAQTPSEFGKCAIADMTGETFADLDADHDSTLTMDEYRACLTEANITLDEASKARFAADYEAADTDGDGKLVLAEVEVGGAAADAPKGTITVTQPAAEVTVSQPPAKVSVNQPEPEVTVKSEEPQVAVSQPKPEVTVTEAEPKVSVTQPEPTVTVSQPEAKVSVSQPDPDVTVEPGKPGVEVATAEPKVDVETAEPDVQVEQPELDVDVEQASPKVAVDDAAPEVELAAGDADEQAAGTQTDSTMVAANSTPAPTTDSVTAEAPDAVVSYSIRVDELEGEDVLNSAGEEIGEIDEVMLDPASGKPVVIVSVGGFLGIGDRDVAFPYDDFTITGDDVVLNTTLTRAEIKAMPEVDDDDYEELPEAMIVR